MQTAHLHFLRHDSYFPQDHDIQFFCFILSQDHQFEGEDIFAAQQQHSLLLSFIDLKPIAWEVTCYAEVFLACGRTKRHSFFALHSLARPTNIWMTSILQSWLKWSSKRTVEMVFQFASLWKSLFFWLPAKWQFSFCGCSQSHTEKSNIQTR